MTIERAEKVIVAGAGLMGRGIAHAFATSGYRTVLFDIDEGALQSANAAIAGIIADGARLGKLTEADADAALGRLTISAVLDEAARDGDLFIETVSENLAIKTAVVAAAEAVLAKDAILATNTSALSVTEIAAACRTPERVAGMHFFNPVHKMRLVELVRGIATSGDTVASLKTYVETIGKSSITVNESPGLTTSRMSAMMGNEAMYMLMEGTASAEDIDTALRLGFNHPMGPLELGDLTGWDTRLSVLKYLHGALGEKFRPCPLIIKMVAAGRIGRKAGHGVYAYDAGGQRVPGSGLRASAL
jgi:3-hydroxybutyryl-CoA dehydrogenase